jgi:hypothetical protein
MVNYNNSKIYKLVCLATNKCYIGSTTKEYLSQRLVQHVAESKSKKPCRSKEIIDGGNYSIILLEAYPCNSRDELKAKEYEYMNKNECINKIKNFGIADPKEYQKNHRKKNGNEINERRRELYKLKKEMLKFNI